MGWSLGKQARASALGAGIQRVGRQAVWQLVSSSLDLNIRFAFPGALDEKRGMPKTIEGKICRRSRDRIASSCLLGHNHETRNDGGY